MLYPIEKIIAALDTAAAEADDLADGAENRIATRLLLDAVGLINDAMALVIKAERYETEPEEPEYEHEDKLGRTFDHLR